MSASRRLRLRAVAALAIAGLGIAAAGCGGDPAPTEADIAAGKEIFTSGQCASCHTLADAGSYSQIGPNLDDSWRASHEAGFTDEQFAGTIKRWIKIAQMPMPRDLVEGQDAANVAAYIASVAGRSPESDVYPGQTAPQVPDPPRLEMY